MILSVCLLVLRLTECCPLLGHLGTFRLEEVAESPGSFVAFLVSSMSTSKALLTVSFAFEGNSEEEEGSFGHDFFYDC